MTPYRCRPLADATAQEAAWLGCVMTMIDGCDLGFSAFQIELKISEAVAACGEEIKRHFIDLRNQKETQACSDG